MLQLLSGLHRSAKADSSGFARPTFEAQTWELGLGFVWGLGLLGFRVYL